MLKRFGVSLEKDLLSQFDALLDSQGYSNRSEAIRDLIRDALIKKEWLEEDIETAGAVIIVYNHHKHELAKKVTDIQHRDFGKVVSSLHLHLDEHNCLEVILLKGRGKEIKQLANSLISTTGVKFGQFVPATSGRNI
ncbi:MAG: nickel-responsive transcriptional regulator NikR [Spirochaetia bacterium]|jgi:CopG family nickel-responsive transcriptional regulator